MLGSVFALSSALFWALAVILFKKAGATFSPISLNIYKSLVALILISATMGILGIDFFPDLPLGDWAWLSLSGFLGITLADLCFFTALNRLGAGLVAVVECLYLPSVLLFSAILLDERLGPAGIALLFWVAGMKYTTASRAAILNQMSTIFIFILAAVWLKEPITRHRALAICLAVAGAWLTIVN